MAVVAVVVIFHSRLSDARNVAWLGKDVRVDSGNVCVVDADH